MELTAIRTQQAPAAIGPYSQGVQAGAWIFTAGQIGLHPETGEIVEGGATGQARQVLANLRAILEAAGSNLRQVVKTTIFLQDLGHFAEVNGVYAEYFADPLPARSTVQVAALPRGALVEIEAIAMKP